MIEVVFGGGDQAKYSYMSRSPSTRAMYSFSTRISICFFKKIQLEKIDTFQNNNNFLVVFFIKNQFLKCYRQLGSCSKFSTVIYLDQRYPGRESCLQLLHYCGNQVVVVQSLPHFHNSNNRRLNKRDATNPFSEIYLRRQAAIFFHAFYSKVTFGFCFLLDRLRNVHFLLFAEKKDQKMIFF